MVSLAEAQPVFTGAEIFPPEEFAARRAKVFAAIGDGVAIVQGTVERPGEQAFRQANQFFYLCGIVEPRAILVMDGRTKRSVAYINARNERREKGQFGPSLYPGPEAVQATGLDDVLVRTEFAAALEGFAKDGRTFFTPFRPEVLGEASATDPAAVFRASKADPWDGRVAREDLFIDKLKAASPQSKVENLDPIIDGLRVIKSAREIAMIREATRISGLGIMEVMRDAKPGMTEYELQATADFIFKKLGAYGPSYFALIATGANTYYSHYHKNTAVLKDGDWVQIDYGPDYKYYQGDITRVFPANGRFTPRQREFYAIYLQMYQALLAPMKPHVAPRDIIKAAVVEMDRAVAAFHFTDPKIKAAAEAFVQRYRTSQSNSLGHHVGMEVHDVMGPTRYETLEPGMVFTIEPAMKIEDERMAMRLEDMLLVTETGVENLSKFVPIEIADVEKLMKQPGISNARMKK
jgi:Xaa-Pro aminopeptidase